jgi:hypothetical protein
MLSGLRDVVARAFDQAGDPATSQDGFLHTPARRGNAQLGAIEGRQKD